MENIISKTKKINKGDIVDNWRITMMLREEINKLIEIVELNETIGDIPVMAYQAKENFTIEIKIIKD